ncbi:RadC family protein [Inediibacterium massiliense]|uniref:RadC family protein n=1 Tax=Inediibacterium massiliense TaxID=1658111 RepID=UPI0006B50F93|nr:DNA repair protein RadC [Inediibacterium massiliense]
MDAHISIREMAKTERPREKLLKWGVECLSNAELLAILIRTGTKDLSALDLAQKVLSIDQEGLRYLTNCTVEELSNIKGIGIAKACQILSSIELGKRLALSSSKEKYSITSPKDVSNILMEEMRYYKKEYFKTILLNTKNEILSIDNISIGSLNSSLVHPREVFVNAIKKSVASIILVHNHPSGNPKPSSEDINVTKRLIEAGKIIGIYILDHIIIGDGKYISLKESNMI